MSEWQPIETAPKDGTEFQVWMPSPSEHWPEGWWEAKARFNPATECFETWGRVDYDEEGWGFCELPTHWMPYPEPPK